MGESKFKKIHKRPKADPNRLLQPGDEWITLGRGKNALKIPLRMLYQGSNNQEEIKRNKFGGLN